MAFETDLISGDSHSLSCLFATANRKIIIPDFQRDYCWGDFLHGEKKVTIVERFLETLKDEYQNGETQLGKIDVYQTPKDHIYLTDGQQRLTTLYLIIGILYKKTKLKKLRGCLISEQEEHNESKEPFLQYAIRESSIYFLRDLVNEYFLAENSILVSDISKQQWFFNEYNLDPTIMSMLNALETIEKGLKETANFKLNEFSEYITDNIKLQYYDVVDRKLGEERFVIINTTGKSLTESENVKPILLGKVNEEKYFKQWEERETWFWKGRNKETERTADEGVNDFLSWSFQIAEKQDAVDLIKKSKELFKKPGSELVSRLELLDNHFEALKRLLELFRFNETVLKQFKFINENKGINDIKGLRELSKDRLENILLPLLHFMVKISSDEIDVCRVLKRLRKNYFDMLWVERNANYVDWRYLLKMIEIEKDVQGFLTFNSFNNGISQIQNVKLNQWYNDDEKWKCQFEKDSESKIEEWEDTPDFMGDLSPLSAVTNYSKDISLVDKYYQSYLDFIHCQQPLKNEILLIRICSNFGSNWFNLQGGFRCIEQNSELKIFNKPWFNRIWILFTENWGDRLRLLKSINRAFLFSMLQEKKYSEDVINKLNYSQPTNISLDLINDFERVRVENWTYSEGYSIAAIYYWMYLENEYSNSQDLSIRFGLNQIGFRIFDEKEVGDFKFSYNNIKVATHFSRGWSLSYNYALMQKIQEIQTNQELNKPDTINQILMQVKFGIIQQQE